MSNKLPFLKKINSILMKIKIKIKTAKKKMFVFKKLKKVIIYI